MTEDINRFANACVRFFGPHDTQFNDSELARNWPTGLTHMTFVSLNFTSPLRVGLKTKKRVNLFHFWEVPPPRFS